MPNSADDLVGLLSLQFCSLIPVLWPPSHIVVMRKCAVVFVYWAGLSGCSSSHCLNINRSRIISSLGGFALCYITTSYRATWSLVNNTAGTIKKRQWTMIVITGSLFSVFIVNTNRHSCGWEGECTKNKSANRHLRIISFLSLLIFLYTHKTTNKPRVVSDLIEFLSVGCSRGNGSS